MPDTEAPAVYACPACDQHTVFAHTASSGGREWQCRSCKSWGALPDDLPAQRATPPRDETPADIIRRAARLIRERANAATPGPWKPFEGGAIIGFKSYGIRDHKPASTYIIGADGHAGIYTSEDATHIASWHPAVAITVAQMLENILTSHYEGTKDLDLDKLCFACVHPWPCDDYANAFHVARTYLGETDA